MSNFASLVSSRIFAGWIQCPAQIIPKESTKVRPHRGLIGVGIRLGFLATDWTLVSSWYGLMILALCTTFQTSVYIGLGHHWPKILRKSFEPHNKWAFQSHSLAAPPTHTCLRISVSLFYFVSTARFHISLSLWYYFFFFFFLITMGIWAAYRPTYELWMVGSDKLPMNLRGT